MSTNSLILKRGDTKRGIQAILKGPEGTPVDLTNCQVRFHMGRKLVGGLVVVMDPTAGKVLYALEASAVDEAGIYRAEFEVIYPDGRRESYPNQGYIIISIIPDIG